MKKTFLQILLLLLIAVSGNAQNIVDNDLVGTWKVTEFQLLSTGLSKKEVSEAETLKKSFLNTHFEFKADKHFSFDFDVAEMKIKNAHWKYSSTTKSAVIQEWKDRNAAKPILMEIYIKREGGKLVFLLSETPFVLQVEKES